MRRDAVLALPLLLAQPATAWAHAFGERYDLPVPLGYFVVGAAATVVLSFAVAAVFMRRVPSAAADAGLVVPLGPLLPAVRAACRVISLILLCMVVVAGLFGTRNPEMNLAPVLVWIVWWQGLSLLVACIGDVWPALDPWHAIFETLDVAARRLGRPRGISLGWRYPQALGAWPAVFLLLLFVWIEVIYPLAALPAQVAWMAVAWSLLTLLGMVWFGADAWRRNVDPFSIYFGMLGRFAPIAAGPDGRSVVVRPPGNGLVAASVASFALAAFVIAMLSTVLFDGVLATQAMALLHRFFINTVPWVAHGTAYFLGTTGLIGTWLVFGLAYLLACGATAGLAGGQSVRALACLFAPTLVPIAIAYNVAHNFSSLLIQGQLLIPLLSDPLGRKWDIFGTALYYPDIGIIDARFTWYLAITSIVAGHVVSIWLAHRLSLREFGARGKAVAASVPLTVLMVFYTAISLLVIAEPLVQFGTPGVAR